MTDYKTRLNNSICLWHKDGKVHVCMVEATLEFAPEILFFEGRKYHKYNNLGFCDALHGEGGQVVGFEFTPIDERDIVYRSQLAQSKNVSIVEIEWLFIQILLKNVPFKSGQHRVPEIYEYRDNVDDVIVVLPTWDDVWGEFAFDLEDENSPRWT